MLELCLSFKGSLTPVTASVLQTPVLTEVTGLLSCRLSDLCGEKWPVWDAKSTIVIPVRSRREAGVSQSCVKEFMFHMGSENCSLNAEKSSSVNICVSGAARRGAAVSNVASHCHLFSNLSSGLFCVECACSPCACVGFLQH